MAIHLDTESFFFSLWRTWYNCCPSVWRLETLHHWIAKEVRPHVKNNSDLQACWIL